MPCRTASRQIDDEILAPRRDEQDRRGVTPPASSERRVASARTRRAAALGSRAARRADRRPDRTPCAPSGGPSARRDRPVPCRSRRHASSRSASPRLPRSDSGMTRSSASCDSSGSADPGDHRTSPDEQQRRPARRRRQAARLVRAYRAAQPSRNPGVVQGSLPAGGDDGAPVEEAGLNHLSSGRWGSRWRRASRVRDTSSAARRSGSTRLAMPRSWAAKCSCKRVPKRWVSASDGMNRLPQQSSISRWHPLFAIDRDDRHLRVDPASPSGSDSESDERRERTPSVKYELCAIESPGRPLAASGRAWSPWTG